MVPFWLHFSVVGVSWAVLGAPWGRLGAVLGRLGASTRSSKFLNDFGIDFWMIFASSWEPFSVQQGPRWRQKSTKNSMGELPERFLEPTIFPIPLLEASGLIFDGFLVDFGWIFDGFFMIF